MTHPGGVTPHVGLGNAPCSMLLRAPCLFLLHHRNSKARRSTTIRCRDTALPYENDAHVRLLTPHEIYMETVDGGSLRVYEHDLKERKYEKTGVRTCAHEAADVTPPAQQPHNPASRVGILLPSLSYYLFVERFRQDLPLQRNSCFYILRCIYVSENGIFAAGV